MAIATIPILSTICIPLQSGPGELCIVLPGGARVCASVDVETGDAAAIVKGLLAQLNTAAAALQPFFNILEFVQAVMDLANSIPKAIAGQPQAFFEALAKLVQAVDKLLAMIPQVSVPLMIATSIQAIIEGIIGVRAKLQAIINHAARVTAALNLAASTGNAQLQLVADCAQDNLDAQMANLNAAFAPLNRLIGVLNTLLELAGLPCIPTLGGIPGPDSSGLAALDAIVQILEGIKAGLPTSLPLPDLPAVGEC